jgi:hypothetical protein
MPDKQKTRNWRDPKTVIATASITAVLTLWNAFATYDRHGTEKVDSHVPSRSTVSQTKSNSICPTPTITEKMGKRCVPVTHTRSS